MNYENDDGPIEGEQMDIEKRLRSLPQIDVPNYLESEVLETIPTTRFEPLQRAPLLRPVAGLAVVASIAVAVLCVRSIDFGSQSSDPSASDTSTAHVLDISFLSNLEETNPCNILPPLHDSY